MLRCLQVALPLGSAVQAAAPQQTTQASTATSSSGPASGPGRPGHTAGHTVYVVESKGQKLVLWGGLMHVASIQFPDPRVTISFDTDSDMAAAQRKRVFADAA